MKIEEQIKILSKELRQHNYNYYTLDNPTISDYEFDLKLKQLQRWENGSYDENGSLKDMGIPENPAILPRIAKLSDDMLEFSEEVKQIEILDKLDFHHRLTVELIYFFQVKSTKR